MVGANGRSASRILPRTGVAVPAGGAGRRYTSLIDSLKNAPNRAIEESAPPPGAAEGGHLPGHVLDQDAEHARTEDLGAGDLATVHDPEECAPA